MRIRGRLKALKTRKHRWISNCILVCSNLCQPHALDFAVLGLRLMHSITRNALPVPPGPVNIQVRDARKLPILEVELHHLVAVATWLGPVLKSYTSFDVALWSHNSMLKAWEPVLEKASLLLHFDQNSSGVVRVFLT